MIALFKRLWCRLFPAAKEPQPVVHSTHRHTLIFAYNYAQAREWAQRNLPKQEDWRYVSNSSQLQGCRNVRIVKLDGWSHNRDRRFMDVVAKLEREVRNEGR